MTLRLRDAVHAALGDRRTIAVGCLLIFLGVVGKLALLTYANIETVFVATLLAGSLLGRGWTVLVPLAILAILQAFLWGVQYPGYGSEAVLGLTFFIVTGFLFVGLAGRAMKRRVLFRMKYLALLTSTSIPLTIGYDLWTDIGDWYFLFRPSGIDFVTVLELQVPFTLYHILSSLMFVPLFGSGFLFLHAHLTTARQEEALPAEPVESL